jgi:uncharacterized Zn-binding protein involved in type VI secretion
VPGGSGQAAARLGDEITHGGPIITGSPDVFIVGPPSARETDLVYCAIHEEQIIAQGSLTVLVNGLPKARVGDLISCAATIAPPGAVTVLVGG